MSHAEGHTPDSDSEGEGGFDIGQAGEGSAYVIEDPSITTPAQPTSTSATNDDAIESQPEGHVGEPDGGLEGEDQDADPDRARAALMRSKRQKLRQVEARSQQHQPLPFIPEDVLPRSSPSTKSSSSKPAAALRRRVPLGPPRPCPQRWWRGFRICMQWRVLKHILAALILPTLTILGLIFYMRMPSNISFAESLIQGDMVTVKWYLDTEKMPLNDPIVGDDQQRSPIHLAAIGNHTALVKHLIFRGALLDLQDANGFTPLHYASHTKNYELTDFLIQQGAPVDATDINGRTPLHIAAITGSVPVLAVLVFNGNADLKVSDRDDYRAVDYSRIFHSSSMQKLLDDGYYHDHSGTMKVISHDKFEAMKRREGVADLSEINGSKKKKKKGKKKKSEPTITLNAKETPSPKPSSPSSSTTTPDLDDDNFMSLFTGTDEANAATARYEREKAAAAAQAKREEAAAHEYADLQSSGPIDEDEFDV